jgi:LysM repeat protein
LPEPSFAPNSGAVNAGTTSVANAFEAFAQGPTPTFSAPQPSSNPPLSTTGPSSADVPEIPSLELPKALPIEPPQLSAPELPVIPEIKPVAPTSPEPTSPPIGSLLPNSKVPESDSKIVQASTTNVQPFETVPALDLPSLHGDSKTIADATEPRMPTSAPGKSFANAKRMALDQANSGKLKEALATLSVFYGAQDLTSHQQNDLIDMLDALAREVIFSPRHLLEVPYIVNPGETLEQVAKTCQVPVSILARINGLDEQAVLPPDRKLKVIQGPFRAEIVLEQSEMTLFLGELYAGRFPLSLGSEPAPRPGVYEVQDKQRDRNYYSANGMQIPAKDPRNPFGGFWIDLGEDLCIPGSSAVETGASNLGCISLSPLDAADVFGMLGRGCQVSIR